jgi:preprotein translocase subunit SecB
MAESDIETGAAAGQQEAPQQQFLTQRIYIKDVSFESPATPGIFQKQWKPAINVDLNTKTERIDENNVEVVLSITITATQDEETAFLVEVQQAGIFMIAGVEGDNLRRILGTVCPNILFPYARETIDSLCVKGAFPALMLAPVNFEAVYQQALTQAQNTPNDGSEATH